MNITNKTELYRRQTAERIAKEVGRIIDRPHDKCYPFAGGLMKQYDFSFILCHLGKIQPVKGLAYIIATLRNESERAGNFSVAKMPEAVQDFVGGL